MAGGGTNSSLRKYLGSIKDTTTISLAKVNSGYKELDIAIVKATNHVEQPAKERHLRAIFAAVSATRPRADVAYCIHGLARRLSKTHNWAVALKTLIVVHQRLECYRVLKYDVETDRPRTKDLDTAELLEQLPALQQLLYRVLGCQPEGAAVHNHVIQLALSMVASESTKIYSAISDGTVNLVDKFFEMQRSDAVKALDIYRRSGQQAERLSEFYEVCKGLDVGRGEKLMKIEQPPASFLQAMEEYVKEAPRSSAFRKEQVKHVVNEKPTDTVVLAIEDKDVTDVKEERPPSPPPPEPVKEEKPVVEIPDLLSMDDPKPVASDLEEKNAMALAIMIQQNPAPKMENGTTGWELALVTTPSSNETMTAAANTRLAGGLDKLTLDSLYDDAMRRTNQPTSYNPWESAPMSNTMMQQPTYGPFYGPNAAPPMQMAAMANQQQAYMLQQQQMMMMGPQQQQMMMMNPQQQMMMGAQQQPQSMNPFANSYAANPYGPGMPMQTYNPYTGHL
ncbi:hypothetical protein RDABS01_035121 [Bienertia sinuspersici]